MSFTRLLPVQGKHECQKQFHKISCFWKPGQRKGLHIICHSEKPSVECVCVCVYASVYRLVDTNSLFRATVCPKFPNELK